MPYIALDDTGNYMQMVEMVEMLDHSMVAQHSSDGGDERDPPIVGED